MRTGARAIGIAMARWLLVAFTAGSLVHATTAGAQEPIYPNEGPRFLIAMQDRAAPVETDASQVPLLRRHVTLTLKDEPLSEALKALKRAAGIEFVYSPGVINSTKRVTLKAGNMTVAAILTDLLLDAQVDVLLSGGKYLTLVPRRSLDAPQAGAIVGSVMDAKTSAKIAGADVLLKGTRWRATTDTNGRYRLADVDSGTYVLTVRRFGYSKLSQQVTVLPDRETTADVTLTALVRRLDELVTTAIGRRRRLDVANDVTTINADSVMQVQPVRNLTDLLETRVPGLTVQHTSGAPGDPSRLRLRGVSSVLRNNDPIVFVDGVRYYGEQSANRSANLAAAPELQNFPGSAQPTDSVLSTGVNIAPSPLDYIDPNSIETIEVLKGPSATTQYGQDAANGVIVITTKKGRAGPPQWSASAEYGRTRIEGEYPELVYRWGHRLYDGISTNCLINNATIEGFPCTGDSVLPFQILNDPALTVLDQGHRTALSLGVSGGSSALTYRVSGSYEDEIGLIKLPDYEVDRYQEKLGASPPDWMRRPENFKQWSVSSAVVAHLGASAEVTLTANLSRNAQQKSTLQSLLPDLMATYVDRSSGKYYRRTTSAGDTIVAVSDALGSYYRRVRANATQFTNGANLTWRARPWLRVTADAGLNAIQRNDQEYFPWGLPNDAGFGQSGNPGALDTTGYINDGQGSSVVSTVNLRAYATRDLGRGFRFRFDLGANYTRTSINDAAEGTWRLTPGSSLEGSAVSFVRRADQSATTFGWYVEPSVGNSKFNFSSGLRLDGSNSFGANVRGIDLPKFPKLGFSYLASDEPWFPLKAVVQSFRVRVAYGRASRQPGVKDRLRLYTTPGSVFAGSDVETGVELLTLGNTEVRPERSAEFEGGFDADLFDSHLSLTLTGSRKTTDDALMPIPVSPSVYGDNVRIIKNIGVTRNTTMELTADAQVLRSDRLVWRIGIAYTQRRDLLVRLGQGVEPFYISGNGGGTPRGVGGGIRMAPGYPLFGRWSRPILGYADANGDGVLQSEEIQLGDTAVYVGATLPNYDATLSTTISLWRQLTLNAAFSYQDGLSQRNEVAQQLAPFSTGQQGPTASLTDQAARTNLGVTDYNWIQTVSIVRFHSLAVSYEVPASLARAFRAQRMNVAVQGSNLRLWTNYRGLDPNVNAFGTGNSVTDTGILPQPRTWQVRVSASY